MSTESLSAGLGQLKITAIKAMQLERFGTLVRIETDSGVVGHGPCTMSAAFCREVIDRLHNYRLPHLGLIGKDPLAINVHFQNMFYIYPQRGRVVDVLSAIDIALWDLAGNALGVPVSKLLGGPFRSEIPVYSHCQATHPLDRGFWQEEAARLKSDPHGFKAYKIDIHHPLGGHMQQGVPSISMADARKVHRAYSLAREALGDEIDIIVHCHNELDVSSAIKVAEAIEPIKPMFYEDAIAPHWSEGWMALRRATNVPLLTGENVGLAEDAMPFILNQAVNCLQPDLMHSGGITGTKLIADMANLYRIPICLHNVSGYVLDMASQQFSAALFNCPMQECRRDADHQPIAGDNPVVIKDGKVQIHQEPGLGLTFNEDWMRAHLAPGEVWWDKM